MLYQIKESPERLTKVHPEDPNAHTLLPSTPHFQVKTLEKKIGEVTWVSVLVHEINWKQGIPLLDFSGLIKTHKT